ncbi:MAG TPA: dihydroxy-acid dehydratase, partial [Rhizorhapis sp.]|nr:dihydroxy-acid dehydratase [Rhizorhapis sp.]
MARLDTRIATVTDRIIERSKPGRGRYLQLMADEAERGISRPRLSCGNFAHGFAAAGEDKQAIKALSGPNLAIVTAYNDMLSAHQPYGRYPEQMKIYAREAGATAQVAGGTPAMCDGVTQGQPGMDLSLFSRDTIALSTAVALSHGMFDGVAMLGICDKIVPGLLIGSLRFGHLPALLVPGGPMPSGLANKEKQRIRQLYAEGKATKEELLASESASYHTAGTCTFYGTANSNQMMMELMGLHIPGAAFINPGTPLRQALTRAAVHRLAGLAGDKARPLGHVIDEKAIVNAAIGLLATGGSTNHAIHLPAIARAAGIILNWQDLDELSAAVPLIARVYPNGSGDVNDFHHAGGMAFVIRNLLEAGLLHADTLTAGADELPAYKGNPRLEGEEIAW